MNSLIAFKNLIDSFDINKGDILFISSDITRLIYIVSGENESLDPNLIIDYFIEKIGNEGTLVLPTFNWDFCKGIPFDYYKTQCKTGVLGKLALKRKDFRRTKHPIYSFAVWGKDKDLLFEMNNVGSFSADSPFNYLHKNRAKNLFIDIDYSESFTFAHYAEACVGVPYRYHKEFLSEYIDENGVKSDRTYSMYVRSIELDLGNNINSIGEIFEEKKIAVRKEFNQIPFVLIGLMESYEVLNDDILNNKSKNIWKYRGQ